jgi:hypothetical protein
VDVLPRIVVEPAKVFHPLAAAAESFEAKVTLRPMSDQDRFDVTAASLEGIPGSVAAAKDPTTPGQWNLKLTAGPFARGQAAIGAVGAIVVTTSHPIVGQVRIPVLVKW